MNSLDAKSGTYINFGAENNDKDPKFKVGDHVRIPKYENIFAKGYVLNQSDDVFLIKKVKNTMPWTYIIENLNGEEIVGPFYKKELQQKISQAKFRKEKVIRRKSDRLCVRCKGYGNAGLKIKISLFKLIYFPGSYSHSKYKIKNKLDLTILQKI